MKDKIPEQEVRHIPVNVEIREEEGKNYLDGYVVEFEKQSHLIWFFREKVRKGAFEETLRNDTIKGLFNHNTDLVLGSTKSGTLKLQEDDRGLKFELELPNTTAGKDAAESIKRGDIDGVSFGFQSITDEWDETDPQEPIRTLVKVKLFEISPTAFPAYPDSQVSARSVKDAYKRFADTAQGSDQSAEIKRKQVLRKRKLELKSKIFGGNNNE